MTHLPFSFVSDSKQASRSRVAAARAAIVGVAALLVSVSHAQPAMPPISSSAASIAPVTAPAAAAQTLPYKSVFERYRSFRDESVGSWRDANDTVTRVGGWREYLKEAQRPDATPQPTPSPVPAPAASPQSHPGHGVKK